MALSGLAGKTAIVTGAAGGIGAAIVARLLAEESNVVGVDLDAGAVERIHVGDHEGRWLAVAADVASEQGCHDYVRQALDRFGGVDLVANNAGILGARAPLTEMPVAEFDRVLGVNLRSVFLGMQAVIRVMIRAGAAPSSTPPPSARSRPTRIRPPMGLRKPPSSNSRGSPPWKTPAIGSA
jgi:NAD(P)-dependent dehydrogenase (short-subunit alcohol dehydrogenase family)